MLAIPFQAPSRGDPKVTTGFLEMSIGRLYSTVKFAVWIPTGLGSMVRERT